MSYTIHDKNGNPYFDVSSNKQTLYMSLKCASKALKELPSQYWIRDRTTNKKVEPI